MMDSSRGFEDCTMYIINGLTVRFQSDGETPREQ
jgi:hypothetical protein